MKGVPNSKNRRQDEETGEFVIYCKIRGDYYDLSRHKNLLQAMRERDKIIANGGFEQAVGWRLKHHGKYYYKRGNNYVVVRQINGKSINFGTYKTEAEAKEIVRVLWKYNWDKKQLPVQYQDKINRKPKYYTFSNGKYLITKKVGDTIRSFGAYSSEEEAQRMVEELKKVNWDINKLSYFDKKQFQKQHKYYTYNKRSNKYTVVKHGQYYGTYLSEEEAIEIVRLLKSVNWDMSQLSSEDYNRLSINQPKNHKNYTYDKSKDDYIVYKTINGKYTRFGRYKTETEAAHMVELLREHDWNIDNLTTNEKKLLNKAEPKHYGYNKRNKTWRVYKSINGKHTIFGEYSSEEDAQKIVQILKENNWNKESITT